MKLILVRHGETVENIEDRSQGHLPGKLSELGILQSKKVGERLKDEKIDTIYSSDLGRAVETAKEIAKHHDIPFILDKGLRERCWGEADGLLHSEIDKIGAENFKGSETLDQFQSRVHDFFDKLEQKHSNDNVLVVCHGGSLVAIISKLQNKPFHEVSPEFINNTSVTVFDDSEMKLFNCTKHL